jgi:hypothetical protein
MKTQEAYEVSETRSTKTENKSFTYNYDVNSAVVYNKKRPYSKQQWKDIQSKLNDSVKESLVLDGIPGKLTANAVYKFQSSKNMTLKDGKLGNNTARELGISDSNNQQTLNTKSDNNSKVSIPNGATIMSTSYTPNLDLLNKHATQEGYSVKNISSSANYVAKYCTGSSSQHQCTRGTSLFLQLASYARGEANKTYASSCAAHLFGSTNPMTKYNISSSVAGEYSKQSGSDKTGKSKMNSAITDKLKKDGDFVTFKYGKSQHIVFYSNSGWYSDFKQGTATGCGNESTKYSQIHYFTR